MQTNAQIELADRYLRETGVSVFLTGKAGTGKTTFLRHVVETVNKRHVVVAPTGVAAVNAGGVTIHSFFQLPFCPYLPDVKELVTEYQMPEQMKQLRKNKADVIRTLDLLIIDEVSMVRADLLDAIDAVLRRYRRNSRPFGGVQLLMIGDVQQLPPVVTDEERPYLERVYPSPFFFHSKALQKLNYTTIELQTVYRQQDAAFLSLLNKIRDNQFDEATLKTLNQRVGAAGAQKQSLFGKNKDQQRPIRLVTHNHQADAINQRELEQLHTKLYSFKADVAGTFPESSAPADNDLQLKVGAQVMFVKNDSTGSHRYYNGKIGTVTALDYNDGEPEIIVTDEEGEAIAVPRDKWENIRYEIDSSDNQIKPKVDGTFMQYPLRLAWAVTIHKAQGLTFDRVEVDAASAFAYGQVYVALSRCRTLEGLTLSSPITSRCAFGNSDVFSFVSSFPEEQNVNSQFESFRKQYYYDLLIELFGFSSLHHVMDRLERLFAERLKNIYPKQYQKISEQMQSVDSLLSVSEKFHCQLHRIEESLLPERIGKGSAYFSTQLETMWREVEPLLDLSIDNKEVGKEYADLAVQLKDVVGLKRYCLDEVRKNGFSIASYQKSKVDYLLQEQKPQRKPKKSAYEGLANPDLVKLLVQWRKDLAEERNIPAYCILQQKALLGIAEKMPRSTKELKSISGVGKVVCQQYGEAILSIVADYIEDNGLDYRMFGKGKKE